MEITLMNICSIMRPAAFRLALFLGVCFALPAAAATQSPQVASPMAATYVEMRDYLPTWQQQDAWVSTIYSLKRNFDDICGDTFCSGEYTNIEALKYRCSVNTSTGIIGECVWVFAASLEEVDADSGKILVRPRIWQCASPLAPSTRAEDLAAAFVNNTQPMEVVLPHTNMTLHESLTDCLH
jgi:hypothetical protein